MVRRARDARRGVEQVAVEPARLVAVCAPVCVCVCAHTCVCVCVCACVCVCVRVRVRGGVTLVRAKLVTFRSVRQKVVGKNALRITVARAVERDFVDPVGRHVARRTCM